MKIYSSPAVLCLCGLLLAACGSDSKPAEAPEPAPAEPAEEMDPPEVDGRDDVTDEIGDALDGDDDTAASEDADY